MKFFLDTEFSEDGPDHPIQLLSIGLVAEGGREFYAVNRDRREDDCNDWVKANVLPHLFEPVRGWEGSLREIAEAVHEFCGHKPEFWGYYADYDWVVFCQMFGAMIDLPRGWPMYCNDIKQLCMSKGNPKLPGKPVVEHNALEDARWNERAYHFLMTGEK